jgi:hypothetical protein
MNLRQARSLEGRTVESVRREKDAVIIRFTDGTAVSIEPTHPSIYAGNNVYWIEKDPGPKDE